MVDATSNESRIYSILYTLLSRSVMKGPILVTTEIDSDFMCDEIGCTSCWSPAYNIKIFVANFRHYVAFLLIGSRVIESSVSSLQRSLE